MLRYSTASMVTDKKIVQVLNEILQSYNMKQGKKYNKLYLTNN